MLAENITDCLFSHWQHTLQSFNVDQITANKAFFQLVSVYSSPSRHYHTLQHIYSVLNTIETFKTYVQDLPSVQLAAWFHDVVYDTHAQDNEEKSAVYAANMLKKLAIPDINIIQVKRLILCTKNHQADDLDSQILLDADLAILAATPIQYQEYAQAIRQEYAWVSEAEYITGRGKVLEHFLQRQSIYLTPLMLESSEELARFNIRTELKFLQKNIGFI
ncbi:HD domain-containing protein [Anabaena sp. WFMT]|uniref:HD domain-containing protein n=1 Tax=Anabaena sp. WFMT TaxID=3449730 RepID=UPI003F29AF07